MKYKLIIDRNAEEEIIAIVHAPSALTQEIENLVHGFSGADFIMGQREDEIRKLSFGEVECITVIDRKVFVIDGNGVKYRVNHRLCELENMLPSCFIRINKSTIANERKIVRFKATFSGAVDAVFKCGYTDYISRRCLADIKRRFEK